MWILKLKIKHKCTIADRCEKYKVSAYSIPLGSWTEKQYNYVSGRHVLCGSPELIKKFVQSTKKDKKIAKVEISGNAIFLIEKSKEKIPSFFYIQKIFFTKPVFVDEKGYEYWEMAAYKKNILTEFWNKLKKEHYIFIEMQQLKNISLDNLYFPAVAPKLTEKQKTAFDLAVKEGYYDIPKRADLKKLSKIMKISLATYQEHLKRAESKIIPRL